MHAALVPRPDRLIVAEIFGPTVQGEGSSLGRCAGFLRLGHCNLTCDWCDTPYTWDWSRYRPESELTSMDLSEVAAAVRAIGTRLLVVTGGEPLMQQPALTRLFGELRDDMEIEVETNGTVCPTPEMAAFVTRFNVSPKLSHAEVLRARRIKPAALKAFRDGGKSVFKFVVREPEDLAEVAAFVDTYGLSPVYVMPEGTTQAQTIARMRRLVDPVIGRGWNLTPRLHVLLWGDRRGR